MCGFCGIYCANGKLLQKAEKYKKVMLEMNRVQKHRGPDEDGYYFDNYCSFSHARLSIMDIKHGSQPLCIQEKNEKFVIVYNGEIYNMKDLKNELINLGMHFNTNCDTEVILRGYIQWGTHVFHRLNGIFSFAIWEEQKKRVTLCRDYFGVKPLFYSLSNKNEIVFASEIKSLLAYDPDLAAVDEKGLCELFALGPAHTSGKTVYKEIKEVQAGTFCQIDSGKINEYAYWNLEAKEHEHDMKETIEYTSYLVQNAIEMQMLSDIPVCTFLSGGLDSSVVSAVAAKHLKTRGTQLSTYSFDFEGNQDYFQSNSFQPTQDAPYALEMAEYLGTNHKILICSNQDLFSHLYTAMKARDYPCMADVESSLLYFCQEVSKDFKVVLTGECADEIFGGYPWFYRKDMFERDAFPWSYDMGARSVLLKDEWIDTLQLETYSLNAYHDAIEKTPRLTGDSPEEARRRELSFLNLKWFMATLLERMDRTSMYNGVEARVPFADYRIVEYLYNVPWKIKYYGNMEKGLLREAMKGVLPEKVLYRKKSPYPKTYNPMYEKLLKDTMMGIIENKNEPIMRFVDENKVKHFLNQPLSYAKPWYGQLMAGPQLLAYFIQINMWLKEYHIRIE